MNCRITGLVLCIMALDNLHTSSKGEDDGVEDEKGDFSSTKAVCGDVRFAEFKPHQNQRFWDRSYEAKAEVTDEASFAMSGGALLDKIDSANALIEFSKRAVDNFKRSPAARLLMSKEELTQLNDRIMEIEQSLDAVKESYQKQSFRDASESLTRVEQKLAELLQSIPHVTSR